MTEEKDENKVKNWKSSMNAIKNVYVQKSGVDARVNHLKKNISIKDPDNFAAWVLKAISVIDLTTLSGDDTATNVKRLCLKAAKPLSSQLYTLLGFPEFGLNDLPPVATAAVCVYPTKVTHAANLLKSMGFKDKIKIAAVATGFPSGLYSIKTRTQEIQYALECGADEIDVVIDRSLVLTGDWATLYNELVEMRRSCGEAHMKVILGVGELGSYANVYKASMVAMYAGADFIKTSTGKEAVNATLPVGLVMCRAIRNYHNTTGRKVGLKPAGGIRTAEDAVDWLAMVREELGSDWLSPELFRIGASGLLGALEKWLHEYATGEVVQADRFSFI